MKIAHNYLVSKRDPHLHSPAHVLADEMANKLGEPRKFGFYLKLAFQVNHNVLRKILGEVLEKGPANPGALFTFLVGKYDREKPTTEGYSIWLKLAPEEKKVFQNLIKVFAEDFKGPIFEPHVTLLSGINLERTEEIFETFPNLFVFDLNLKKDLRAGDRYFRGVYLEVEISKALNAAHRMAKKLFDTKAGQKYSPHLSLAYANHKPEVQNTILPAATYSFPSLITIREIALVKTDGPVSEFKIIKTCQLTPPQ